MKRTLASLVIGLFFALVFSSKADSMRWIAVKDDPDFEVLDV